MKGTEATAERDRLDLAATAVRRDPGHYLIDDPGLIPAVPLCPLLDRNRRVGPGLRVVAVDAVELQASFFEQAGDGSDHAIVLKIGCLALLGGEYQHGPS